MLPCRFFLRREGACSSSTYLDISKRECSLAIDFRWPVALALALALLNKASGHDNGAGVALPDHAPKMRQAGGEGSVERPRRREEAVRGRNQKERSGGHGQKA